jgi:hypothetical protein
MRAAQIYVRRPSPAIVERIASAVLSDPRVDQVLWRAGPATDPASCYTAASARGRLEFRHGGGADSSSIDLFGGRWTWQGDPAALGVVQEGRTVLFDEYPNAFERLAGVLDLPQSGELWITAKPGCEFEVPGGVAHAGGASHGALHALDSLCPVILAGGPSRLALPRHMRSVDIAPLCMDLLGIPMRYHVGDPRRHA